MSSHSVAQFIGSTYEPPTVRVAWGDSVYDYYLDGKEKISTYLFLYRKAGGNKAAIWLKKNAYKYELVYKKEKQYGNTTE